jgi:hypothetical protein
MRQSQPHLVPPFIDLDHVSQYNEHGKVLCSLIRERAIPDKHHILILGLFGVYSLLVSIGHLDPANISWAPHADFDRQGWLDAGFTAEVVDILEFLPYLKCNTRGGELVQVAHNSPALSYLSHAHPTYRGPDQIPNFVAPTDFFVTGEDVFSNFHYFYLYKSDDGISLSREGNVDADDPAATMTIVHPWQDHWEEYRSLPFHPAELIMNNWAQNIHDLVYLPGYTELDALELFEFDTRTLSRKVRSEADFLAYATQGDWPEKFPAIIDKRLNDINSFRGIRNMYRKFGWPHKFDREGFSSASKEFDKKVYDYNKRLRQSNPKTHWLVENIVLSPEDRAIIEEKSEFLEEAAGPLAIRLVQS